jgi:hypothetical protein
MATLNRNIPFYWAELSDNEDGMVCVSLVDNPAVVRDFMAFSAEKKIPVCAISNEEKRLVRGVLMRADFPIYRVAPTGEEFYIIFSAHTIRRMTERFLEQGNQGNVNTMHAPGSDVEGVNLVQLFIKDKSAGIDPAGFEDVEDGSLFGEYHVANDDVWADIKAGKFKGFSIEGIFSVSNHQFNKHQINEMAKLEKLKTRLAKLLAEFGVVSTDKGALYWDGDEDLKAGDMVHKESESGERSAAPDGQYTTEDGKTIVVVDGKVSEIVDPKAEVDGAGETPPAGSTEPTPPEGDPSPGVAELQEIREEVAEIRDMVEKLMGAIESTKSDVKAMKQAPAASSAHEEFKNLTPGKTGDSRLDHLAAVVGAKK